MSRGACGWLIPGRRSRLGPGEWPWLVGAVLAGGVAGPVLLLYGLSATTASTASLLLNAEGVFTALLAWVAFKENADRRIVLGMLAIVAGAVVLSWPHGSVEASWPALAVLGACLCWAIDNNLTRRVSLADPLQIAAIKGVGAGVTNVGLAVVTPAHLLGAGIGLRQSLDTVGAFVGPIIAVLVMSLSGDYRLVFWIAAIPACLAVLVIVTAVKEPTVHGEARANGIKWSSS